MNGRRAARYRPVQLARRESVNVVRKLQDNGPSVGHENEIGCCPDVAEGGMMVALASDQSGWSFPCQDVRQLKIRDSACPASTFRAHLTAYS